MLYSKSRIQIFIAATSLMPVTTLHHIPLKTLVWNWPVTGFRFCALLPTGVGYSLRPSIRAPDGRLILAVEEPST
ncbi:hypothetical protein WN944_021872 [Citrus x changshan-huyou]|uniref:Uncharacterized protein n=1 Tax=Citrus x changshan-huyou TaxID=2935761 RepID=A0AAP0R031_9ROSI